MRFHLATATVAFSALILLTPGSAQATTPAAVTQIRSGSTSRSKPLPTARTCAGSPRQFGYDFDREFQNVVMDRSAANDDLLRMLFDKPEFAEALTTWARHEVFTKIR